MNTLCFGIFVMICQPADPPKPSVVVCPPVVQWSAGDQKAASAELKKLPAGHPLRVMATVTVRQRDINRACETAKGGAAK